MDRVAEENQQERAHQEAQAERSEAQHWLIAEAQRQAAREREEAENEQRRRALRHPQAARR